MNRKGIKIGGIVEIPLSDGRKAYGQYVYKDQKMGPLIQVFDTVVQEELETEQLKDKLRRAKPLFPPIITGLFAAVRTGFWKVVAQMPVDRFVYPGFISAMHENYIQSGPWYLWNSDGWVQLGHELPKKYRHLEFLAVWEPHDVSHRIETGENPYDKLIHSSGC
jgi:hypothetical protein